MTKDGSAKRFWWLLSVVNVVGVGYPVLLVRRAQSVEDNLFAVFLLIFVLFLMVVVDMVSIIIAEAIA